MGTITIGNSQADPHQPTIHAYPVFYTKPVWGAEWRLEPEFEFDNLIVASAGHGDSTLSVDFRYGYKKWITQTDFEIVQPLQNYTNRWIRMDLVSGTAHRIAFQGIIREEKRTIHGTKEYDSTDVELGNQHFMAWGPKSMLRKTHVTKSYWADSSGTITCEWMPDINIRDEKQKGRLLGNRSAHMHAGSYVFGGQTMWSHFDFLEYLIQNHFPATVTWRISGQAHLLQDIYTHISLRPAMTIADILAHLIPLDYGIDYHLIPVDDGFAIHVYALNSMDINFGGGIMPRNPDYLKMKTTSDVGSIHRIQVEKTENYKYAGVRLWGQRAVICASPTPVGKWDSDLAYDYQFGTGDINDSSDAHDAARRRDRYDHVFQRYGASSTWTLSRQAVVRSTLSWLPLREGYDYSTAPPTNLNSDGITPGFQRPNAWVLDPTTERYIPAAKGLNNTATGMNISTLDDDWGLLLEPQINHILAKDHVPNIIPGQHSSNYEAQYDYDDLVMTIAVRADTRLMLEYIPGGADGTVKEVYDNTAQLWELAPDTVVGVDEDGELLTSGSDWRTLRDDSAHMYLKMAGLIARYVTDRARAVVYMKGLYCPTYLIGKMVTVVDGTQDTQTVQAPVTQMQLTSDGTSIFKTGYAQS
jgi:hypothetical protein